MRDEQGPGSEGVRGQAVVLPTVPTSLNLGKLPTSRVRVRDPWQAILELYAPLASQPELHAEGAASIRQGAPERGDGARDLSLARVRARAL